MERDKQQTKDTTHELHGLLGGGNAVEMEKGSRECEEVKGGLQFYFKWTRSNGRYLEHM